MNRDEFKQHLRARRQSLDEEANAQEAAAKAKASTLNAKLDGLRTKLRDEVVSPLLQDFCEVEGYSAEPSGSLKGDLLARVKRKPMVVTVSAPHDAFGDGVMLTLYVSTDYPQPHLAPQTEQYSVKFEEPDLEGAANFLGSHLLNLQPRRP